MFSYSKLKSEQGNCFLKENAENHYNRSSFPLKDGHPEARQLDPVPYCIDRDSNPV